MRVRAGSTDGLEATTATAPQGNWTSQPAPPRSTRNVADIARFEREAQRRWRLPAVPLGIGHSVRPVIAALDSRSCAGHDDSGALATLIA